MPILCLRKTSFLKPESCGSSSNFSLLPGSHPQHGVHFFLPKSLGMFVVFRNVISARFLRSNVPDRSWLLMKQLSAHHQRFCRDEVCEHV